LNLPDSAFTVGVFFALLLPGLVFSYTDSALRGFRSDDKSADLRVMRALAVSAILDGLYLLLVPAALTKRLLGFVANPASFDSEGDSTFVSLVVLLLGAVVPAALALLIYRVRKWGTESEKWVFRRVRRLTPYRSLPTAWDASVVRDGVRFVRIQAPDGRWFAGFYSDESYASTFPEKPDIFIAHQYAVDDDGAIGDPVENSAGLWLSIGDGWLVEWLNIEDEG